MPVRQREVLAGKRLMENQVSKKILNVRSWANAEGGKVRMRPDENAIIGLRGRG
jgi:hypothetical protein